MSWAIAGLMAGTAIPNYADAASTGPLNKRHDFNVPAQDVGSALVALSRQSGVNVLFCYNDVANRRAPAIHGQYTTEQAIRLILTGSALRPVRTGSTSYSITGGGGSCARPLPANYGTTAASAPGHAGPSTIAAETPAPADPEQVDGEQNHVLDGQRRLALQCRSRHPGG